MPCRPRWTPMHSCRDGSGCRRSARAAMTASATWPAPAWSAMCSSIRKHACRATCARCWTTEAGSDLRRPRRMAGMPDTLAQPVSHTLEVKHSRFIAHAAPIDGAAAALAFLQQVAVADATHNCWAYRHGQDYRSSDDGEPAGTAGRPILAAIDGQGFDRVMVVVTRWFGGIKLGAGGLVRAYGGAAAECLRTAP